MEVKGKDKKKTIEKIGIDIKKSRERNNNKK